VPPLLPTALLLQVLVQMAALAAAALLAGRQHCQC
jgi:hypothetical protein